MGNGPIFNTSSTPCIEQTSEKNWTLGSGERQTAKTIEGIRKDHVNRYKYVARLVNRSFGSRPELRVLDCFCGNGYGSYLLAQECEAVQIDGIDGSQEAIDFAKENFAHDGVNYQQCIFPDRPDVKGLYDIVVSIESIEHVHDDVGFLNYLVSNLRKGGFLVLSYPNKKKLDLDKNPNKFHVRHYDNDDIFKLIEACVDIESMSLSVCESFGQDVYTLNDGGRITGRIDEDEMYIKEDYEGQFLILVLAKIN